MKKLFIFLFALVLSFSIIGTVNADLINNGGNLIYDTDLKITWYDPAATATSMILSDAKSWVAGVAIGGTVAGTWRLPTTPGTIIGKTDEGELGHLFYYELGGVWTQSIATTHNLNYALFTNLQAGVYWTGTPPHSPLPGAVYDFMFNNENGVSNPAGGQWTDDATSSNYVLAVHDGDIGPNGPISTPEPASMLLLGLGLMGVAGVRRKFRK